MSSPGSPFMKFRKGKDINEDLFDPHREDFVNLNNYLNTYKNKLYLSDIPPPVQKKKKKNDLRFTW